jgi:hypothetical protein
MMNIAFASALEHWLASPHGLLLVNTHDKKEQRMHMLKLLVWIGISLALAYLAAFWAGAYRWEKVTQQLVQSIHAAQQAPRVARFNPQELQGLPEPVQLYFRTVLREGQPVVTALHIQHTGTFNMGEQQDQWKPLSSVQCVSTQAPGFVWNGTVNMLPGVPVRVHDAYVNGQGLLHPAVLGLVSLTKMQGKGDIAQGELLRYLAEAPWYPTAFLPSQGVRWEAVDQHSARAHFADGDVRASVLFQFGSDHLIERIYVPARGRTVGNAIVMTPWEGLWKNYITHDGMRVPTQGEVAWITPAGRKPYWRANVIQLAYTFAPA